ncbi:MAG: hypothetical protein KatS3mg015_2701 [Fimbriimonadales bacterium]|nr:MAG: hypothetical protein KatS3mg015_2701 [Fimbriimonadales bacterium]
MNALRLMTKVIMVEIGHGAAALAYLENWQRLKVEYEIKWLGEFWWAMHVLAADQLLTAIARIYDTSRESVSIHTVLKRLEHHAEECEWLFSHEARLDFPNPDEAVDRLLRKWSQEVRISIRDRLNRVKEVRDKLIAHRDTKVVLQKISIEPLLLADVRRLLEAAEEFTNDVYLLTDNGEYSSELFYEDVRKDLAFTLEMFKQGLVSARQRLDDNLRP